MRYTTFLLIASLPFVSGCNEDADNNTDAIDSALEAVMPDLGTGDSDGPTAPDSSGPDSEPTTPDMTQDCTLSEDEQKMLDLVNDARAFDRQCGSEFFPATHELTWHCQLATAAARHSQDMADNNFFSHTGSDASSVANRVSDSEYLWSAVGENIAAGQTSIEQVMEGWLASPGHCRNIMSDSYENFASSLVESSGTRYRTYWTQVFARPR